MKVSGRGLWEKRSGNEIYMTSRKLQAKIRRMTCDFWAFGVTGINGMTRLFLMVPGKILVVKQHKRKVLPKLSVLCYPLTSGRGIEAYENLTFIKCQGTVVRINTRKSCGKIIAVCFQFLPLSQKNVREPDLVFLKRTPYKMIVQRVK